METIYKKNIFHLHPPVDCTQSSGHEINNTNSQQNSLKAVGHERQLGKLVSMGKMCISSKMFSKENETVFFLK